MIRRPMIGALVALVASASAAAQDPYVLAPQAYQQQLENDWVRVTKVHYAPHEQIAEHKHPVRPTIYVYLKDGGPVLFKHEHGISGTMAATRPATRAGAYRMAAGRDETHVVENTSELASDFLQVEIKSPINLTTFPARRSAAGIDRTQHSSTVEVDIPELRIRRVVCVDAASCEVRSASAALLVAFPSGATTWLTAEGTDAHAAGEYLVIEFKPGS